MGERGTEYITAAQCIFCFVVIEMDGVCAHLLRFLHTYIVSMVLVYTRTLYTLTWQFRAIGTYGPEDGEFQHPEGICLYKDELFVCDRSAGRVIVFN